MLAAAACGTVLDPTPRTAPGPAGRRTPARATDPEDPAYVLFTSGSTAEPKPVVTSRRAISVAVSSLRALFGLTTADRVLQFASLNWDTCLEEILPTLSAGAALIFDDDAHSGSFPVFLRMIARHRISVLNLPTAFWHELVRYLGEEGTVLPDCLRLVIIGGEAARAPRLVEWRGLDTGAVRLLNTYGCTETTLITHAVDLHGPRAYRQVDAGAADRVPIGRALPHVFEHVTAEGELLIGGPGLFSGYRGMPAATTARCVTPAGGTGRYFRTGDRVGRRPDGMLVHEGRLDDEVKIRGVRVDPAEVEEQIARHPGVGAIAVVPVRTADHTSLAAYVVPTSGTDGAGLDREIHSYLRDRAPAHLRPGRISIVSRLVHTASGKVDRMASHRQHVAARQVAEADR